VTYYEPTDRGFEATIRERMAEIANRRAVSREAQPSADAAPQETKPKRGKKP
jgi:hypothetical protein